MCSVRQIGCSVSTRVNGRRRRVHKTIGMALRPVQVNMKALDDSAVGRFWAEALGWGVSSEGPGVTNMEPGDGFVWPDPGAVCVDVVTVPEP